MTKLIEELATVAAFFGGLAAVVYGIFLWSPPSAYVVGGLAVSLLAVLYTNQAKKSAEGEA